MDNAQKAIMIGVGLFITIIIIGAVMLIMSYGQNMMNQGTERLGTISSSLDSSLTDNYDNKVCSGAQVLAAVKNYYNSTEIGIVVRNNTSGTTYSYCGAKKITLPSNPSTVGNISVTSVSDFNSTTKTALANFSDSSKNTGKDYIITTGQYKSELIKLNGATVGVAFLRIA